MTACLHDLSLVIAEIYGHGLLRLDIESGNHSCKYLHTINLDIPFHHVAGKIYEEILVIYIYLSCKRLSCGGSSQD